MAKKRTIQELRVWRMSRGLTMEAAGALIRIAHDDPNDVGVSRVTWHSWERGAKIPSAAYMTELERVTGVQPNAYYDRPASRIVVPENDQRQMALIA